MDDTLRVGVAVFNAGDHRAAHEAWESKWLSLREGSRDERPPPELEWRGGPRRERRGLS